MGRSWPHRHRLPVVALAAAAFGAGCDAGGDPPLERATYDSAGVRIVQRPSAHWPASGAWTLDHRPSTVIRSGLGDSGTGLFRVAGALRLSDRRIVVGNAGSHDLLFFDTAGTLLRQVGGEGEGPGEFRAISGIARYRGDSIAVHDAALARVSIFDSGGGYGRSITLVGTPASSALALAGALPDGGLVFTTFEWIETREPRRMPGAVLRWTADGASADSIATFPGPEVYWLSLPGFPPGPRLRPFGPTTSVVVDSDRIHIALGDQPEVRTFSLAGELTRILRTDHPRLPVTAEMRDRFARDRIEAAPTPRAREVREYEHRRGRIDFPQRLPAFGTALISDGCLWIEEYRPPDSDGARFSIVGPDAELRGTIELPAGLRPLDLGSDFLLALALDSLGSERVQLHRLDRGESSKHSY